MKRGLSMGDTLGLIALILSILGAVFAAGQWVSRLDARVSTLEQQQQYLHGTVEVPKETR